MGKPIYGKGKGNLAVRKTGKNYTLRNKLEEVSHFEKNQDQYEISDSESNRENRNKSEQKKKQKGKVKSKRG